MPIWVQAGLWGLAAGGALVVGAFIAWIIEVPQRIVASVMAFGAGVLISALAFDLVDEAETSGGLPATVLGFLGGAAAYVLANVALAKRGARHRKRSDDQQPTEDEQEGSGSAIAVGALLDGIPESVVLGRLSSRKGSAFGTRSSIFRATGESVLQASDTLISVEGERPSRGSLVDEVEPRIRGTAPGVADNARHGGGRAGRVGALDRDPSESRR